MLLVPDSTVADSNEQTWPLVSVIVPVYNEEALLSSCLRALCAQDYPGPYEIIVVDNASTDSSREIAHQFPVRVVEEPCKGYAYALRRGCEQARGEFIACTDADSIVPTDWLRRLVQDFQRWPEAVCVGGYFSQHDGQRWMRTAYEAFNRVGRCLPWLWHPCGANLAFRTRAYRQVGGVDTTFHTMADARLVNRFRQVGQVRMDPDLIVATSGRRWERSLLRTVIFYGLNEICHLLLQRPLVADFADIRDMQRRGRHHWRWATAVTLSLALLLFLTYAGMSPSVQAFGRVYSYVPVSQKLVALTFDDGPNGQYTERLLDILHDKGVRATFFVVGRNVDRQPALARRIVAEGHVLGNHTYSHSLWTPLMDDPHAARELVGCSEAVHRATGVWPSLFRPPHGYRSPWLVGLAHQQGYTVVEWSVATEEHHAASRQGIARSIVARVRPGAIILLHDGFETQQGYNTSTTIEAVPLIIEALRAKGYQLVTVPQLLKAEQHLPAE